jgi:hypothetical protein
MFDATNQIDVQLGLLKEPLTAEQLHGVYTLDFIPKRFIAP